MKEKEVRDIIIGSIDSSIQYFYLTEESIKLLEGAVVDWMVLHDITSPSIPNWIKTFIMAGKIYESNNELMVSYCRNDSYVHNYLRPCRFLIYNKHFGLNYIVEENTKKEFML